jgi:DNA-binding NarL/FixJ family response regulator
MLVDDHPLVRSGLEQLLAGADGIEVVGTFATGREAVESVIEMSADVALMDISMPGMDGIAATRALLAKRPATRVVMLTSFAEAEMVLSALDAGASGYLLKDAEPEEVIRAIKATVLGDAPFSPRAARALLGARDRGAPQESLTAREEEVLTLVGEGLANKQIARRLGISEKTVKAHLTHIFERLGVQSRTEAALRWRERSQGRRT